MCVCVRVCARDWERASRGGRDCFVGGGGGLGRTRKVGESNVFE